MRDLIEVHFVAIVGIVATPMNDRDVSRLPGVEDPPEHDVHHPGEAFEVILVHSEVVKVCFISIRRVFPWLQVEGFEHRVDPNRECNEDIQE